MVNYQQGDTYNQNLHPYCLYLFFRILKVLIVLLLIYTQIGLLPSLAQEPAAPFEIAIAPAAGQVVAGEVFTYFVTITNTAQHSVQNVIITVETPKGTTFQGAEILTQQRWLMGGFNPGQPGRIFWLAEEGLAEGEVAQLKLEVNVLSTSISEIVNQEYFVSTLENYDTMTISGPPVRTQVIIPTPTPTLIPQPTVTPMPAETSVAKLTDIPDTTLTTTPINNHQDIAVPEKIETVVSQADNLDNAGVLLLSVISVSAIVAGISWFLIKKRR